MRSTKTDLPLSMREDHESLYRCLTCEQFTLAEEGFGYIHNDNPDHNLSGVYCDEVCFTQRTEA